MGSRVMSLLGDVEYIKSLSNYVIFTTGIQIIKGYSVLFASQMETVRGQLVSILADENITNKNYNN